MLLYCVIKPIYIFYICVYKNISIYVHMKLTYLWNIFIIIYTLKEFVSRMPDTVYTKMLLTRFMKAWLHCFRYEIKRVYIQIKRFYRGVILVVKSIRGNLHFSLFYIASIFFLLENSVIARDIKDHCFRSRYKVLE